MINKQKRRNLLAAVVFITLVSLMVGVTSVRADIGIISVQPNSISNTNSAELVITGTDFAEGAVVLLSNYGTLSATFVSATVLTAIVPAGLTPGSYTITVVNPDSSSASLPGALTVLQATETAESPTSTPEVDETTIPSDRPLVVVESYNSGAESLSSNQEFELSIRLKNIGSAMAMNLIANFPPGDVVPRVSGGVLAMTELDPGEKRKFVQPLTATYEIIGKTVATVVMQISYTDPDGVVYTETFNMTIPVTTGSYVPTSTPTPTPTAPPSPRPQLVIPSFNTDVSPLQPGTIFNLNLRVENKGNANARRVSMILGGGDSSDGVPPGTPDVGGVSGGGGDFGNFAPVSSSNVQFLGDLASGASMAVDASLIVNAATNPGAYPMMISFTYVDDRGQIYTDDQVVTLLVYQIPQVDVNFYRQPDPLFAGQQGVLPVQVVNLGRKAVVLGSMTLSGSGAQYTNNTILVGALDVGGYFTLDAFAMPDAPGTLEIMVTIDYTDDFNQPQLITDTLSIDVQEMFIPEPLPGEGGVEGPEGPGPVEPETFWQKVVRFIKGLIGLNSSVPTPVPGEMPPLEAPSEEIPPAGPAVVPAPPKG